MESFLSNYKQKCKDYSIQPKQRLVNEVEKGIENKEIFYHVVLNGNCDMMRKDRMSDLDVFPLCEVLETDSLSLSLDLSYNHISDQGTNAIARFITSNNKMKHLSLRGNSIGEKGAIELAEALSSNTTLTSFDLSENEIGDSGGLSIIQMLTFNRTLQRLNLNNTGIKTVALTHLALILRKHPSLSELGIAKPYLHSVEETCIHIAEMLKQNEVMHTIDLSFVGIHAEAMKLLYRGMAQNKILTNLNLCGNEISIDGAIELARYVASSNCVLRHLNLSGNKIRDKGCTVLSRAIKVNKTLESIDISRNSIFDEGLTEIGSVVLNKMDAATGSVPHLRKLLVLHNNFGQESMQIFQEIQHRNEKFVEENTKKHKRKRKKLLSELIEVDVVIYKVDDLFYSAEKKECIKVTTNVGTTPEQVNNLDNIVGIQKEWNDLNK